MRHLIARLIGVVLGLLILAVLIAHSAVQFSQGSDLGMILCSLSYAPVSWIIALALLGALATSLLGKPRIALLLVLLSLLDLLVNGDFTLKIQNTSASPHSKLKVLTWNVQYYNAGVEPVLSAIARVGPDIALLCENRLRDEDKYLLQKILPEYRYHADDPYGHAVLSKLPLEQVRIVALPSRQSSVVTGNLVALQGQNPLRHFVHAEFKYLDQKIHALSIRLIAGRSSGNPWERLKWAIYLLKEQQAEVAFVRSYLASLEGAIVFGGDLNAPPPSQVMRQLASEYQDTRLASRYWGGFTFRVPFPKTMRLDYLFASKKHWQVLDSTYLESSLSDHYGVIADLQLRPEIL